MNYEAVVMGVSAGGMYALEKIFSGLSASFTLPIMIVQHLHAHSGDFLAKYLNTMSPLHIKEAEEKEQIKDSTVYFAPANYHLLVEENRSLSLTVDPKVNYCRPSIDLLFKSACSIYGKGLIGIILSGSNHDGAEGMKCIKEAGGLTIVQDPYGAEVDIMPLATMKVVSVDYTIPIEKMSFFLEKLQRDHI